MHLQVLRMYPFLQVEERGRFDIHLTFIKSLVGASESQIPSISTAFSTSRFRENKAEKEEPERERGRPTVERRLWSEAARLRESPTVAILVRGKRAWNSSAVLGT